MNELKLNGVLTPRPVPAPFTDDTSVRLQGGDPGRTPPSECVHSWHALTGRPYWFKCHDCGTVEHLVD